MKRPQHFDKNFKKGVDNCKNGIIIELYSDLGVQLRRINMNWYEKVLDVMKRKNITQKDLAKKSGIAESSLSRYLRSENRPRMDVVINIAKALEIETQYLLDEEETSESAFNSIATAVARKGNELTAEEKNRLIALILGTGN